MVLKVERFKTNLHRRLVFRQLRSTKYTPLEVIYIYILQVTRSPMDSFSQLSFVKQIEPLTGKKVMFGPHPVKYDYHLTIRIWRYSCSTFGLGSSKWWSLSPKKLHPKRSTLSSLRRHTHQQQRSNLLTNLRASTAVFMVTWCNLGVMTCGL